MKRDNNTNHGEVDHISTRYYTADEDAAKLTNYETARIEALTAERDALREALRPFAEEAQPLDASLPDDLEIIELSSCDITVGDLRRAAALLKGGAG